MTEIKEKRWTRPDELRERSKIYPFIATETCEESLKLCVLYFRAVCEHYINQAAGELLSLS